MSHRFVFCLASSRGRADRIVDELKQSGFLNTEVSVLFLDRGTRDEGIAAMDPGAASGREIRGVMMWVGDIEPCVLRDGVRVIAGGLLRAACEDPAVAGIAGSLVGLGVPQEESVRCAAAIQEGQVFISVHAANPERSDQARDTLVARGANEVLTVMQLNTCGSNPDSSRHFFRPVAATPGAFPGSRS